MSEQRSNRQPVVLGPGEGREYPGGPVSTIFKADVAETGGAYSISEWWLEPHTKGPGPHSYVKDDVMYVLAGTLCVLVYAQWIDASASSFILVPGGTTHSFDNRGSERAGFLSVCAPGNFKQELPGISQWFPERSPDDSRA